MTKNTSHSNDSQLDAMLAQWPVAARSVGEWDDKVAQLMARLGPTDTRETASSADHGEGGLHGTRLAIGKEPSDEKILLAPLLDGVITPPKSAPTRVSERLTQAQAQSTEPGSNETSLEDRMSGAERSRSLKDLAKMAQSSPPSSVSRQAPASVRDDSGMIDLAATFGSDAAPSNTNMGSEPAAPLHSMTVPTSQHAQQSVPHIPAASTLPSFDMPPSSHGMIAAAPPSYAPESFAPISAPPQSAAFVAAPAAVAAPIVDHSIYAVPPVVQQKSSGTGKVIAIGLVGLFAVAAAAGGFFFMSKSKADTTATQVAKNDVQPAVASPKAEVVAPAADQGPANAGVDLNNIPTTPQAGKPVAQAVAGKPGSAVPVAAPLAAAPAPEKPEAKKPEAPKAPEGPAGSLGDAMKQAVGPVADSAGQAKNNEPQFAAGSVPQKPSQGALTSALSSVMGSARSCGADEEGVSRATVTFGSAGSVQSVNVSGAAAGKPAAECIKGALSKAKVAPFAEPTFTTTVTIRH